MCFLEGFWDFVLRFFFPLYLQYLEDHLQQADDGGKVWKAALAGVSAVGYCRWTTTMWIHIAKYPFWQRGNSNEMEQRVGEPDRVIEEIQVFHRRSQLWGTQCCKPGVTWNLHAAIWLKLETLKWHWILGVPRGLICLCWRCHFMHGSSYAYYNQATFCGGWHLCGVNYAASPDVSLRSFHKLSDMCFMLCRHVQWPQNRSSSSFEDGEISILGVPITTPDRERNMSTKAEEVSFCPVVFGLGYNWTTAIVDCFAFMWGLSDFKHSVGMIHAWSSLSDSPFSWFSPFFSVFLFLVT
jgi:hypothetical protein